MFDGKLNKFCKEANDRASEKGFWDDMDISLQVIDSNTKSNDIISAVKDAFIAQKVALIMSECGESLDAMREDNYGLEKKDSFEDELADVFIRLADLCGEMKIDIEKQITWKMNYNADREAKHGKSF